MADHSPVAAAVEEVFVNQNPQSTLKLGQARGIVLMCAARAGIEVGEYSPTLVKKAVSGGCEGVLQFETAPVYAPARS